MELTNLILAIIYYVLMIPTLFLACYYCVFAIISLFAGKQKYELVEDKLRFCIFVPCHNEEDVIAATVKNLAKITYNPDLFDIFFIADNCNDNTAERVREVITALDIKNFHALERHESNPKKRGKPHAMRWGIDLLEKDDAFYNKYDMFMIFDADNFVDADILTHMNSQYLSYPEDKRPVMIQAYLDSKNKNNIIARGYYVAYRYTNRFFQLARHKLGLVPGIGGTGFATSTTFLKNIGGYNCSSLVEDLEFETVATMHGQTIAYNHNVRIYDEKPTGLVASAVQKTRWCQGHWYIYFKYGWRLLFKMFNPREIKLIFKRFDNLIHLSTLVFMLLSFTVAAYQIVIDILKLWIPGLGYAQYVPTGLWISCTCLFVFSILLFPISSLLDGTPKEKKAVLIEFIPNLIATVVMVAVYYYSNIVGLLHWKNQTVWKKTAHKVTTMEESVIPPATKDDATVHTLVGGNGSND